MRFFGYFARFACFLWVIVLMIIQIMPAYAESLTNAEEQGKALRAAAEKGEIRVVQTFLDLGVDINVMEVGVTPRPGEEIRGWTALMAAASKGRTPVARLLLARGADANKEDHQQMGALEWAVIHGHLGCVKLLFDRTTRPHAQGDALVSAVIFHHPAILKYLLYKGVPVESQARGSGNTAFVAAAENGCLDCVKLLLQHRANIKTSDAHGYTPLMMAAYARHLAMVKFLLRIGADVNSRDKEGRSAVMWAEETAPRDNCKKEEQSILRILKQVGAKEEPL